MSRPQVSPSVFGAVMHPMRRKIIERLASRPLSVSEIAEPFSCSGPTLTYHLRILREAGLVRSKRRGTSLIYSLHIKPLRELRNWVRRLDDHLGA